MAWKGDGSGRKDSPRGGVSGGGLAGGGRQGNAGGGYVSGMTGATARRTPVRSPSYEASLGNLARVAGTMVPGGGLVTGAKALINGDFSGGFTGYQGQVNTPGSYDPKGGPMAGASQGGLMGYPAGYPVDRIMRAQGLIPPQPARAAAPQSQGLMWKPQTYGPTQINIPGALDYGALLDSWKYFT